MERRFDPLVQSGGAGDGEAAQLLTSPGQQQPPFGLVELDAREPFGCPDVVDGYRWLVILPRVAHEAILTCGALDTGREASSSGIR